MQKKNQQVFLKRTAERLPPRLSPALLILEINSVSPAGGFAWVCKQETKDLPVIPVTPVAPPPFKIPLEPLTGSRSSADAFERPQVTTSHQPGLVSPELGLLVTQEATLETFLYPSPSSSSLKNVLPLQQQARAPFSGLDAFPLQQWSHTRRLFFKPGNQQDWLTDWRRKTGWPQTLWSS